MNREIALNLLAQPKLQLRRQLGVRSLALFGCSSRDTAVEDSDVDVSISFDVPTTFQQYFGAQFYPEDFLKCPQVLVAEKAVHKELRPSIERDAVHV